MPIYKTKNEDFFKIWTPEMAYVLGFFAADGNMIKNRRGAHFINFEITDKELLEKIRGALDSNHKIAVLPRNDKWKTSYRLQVGSKTMFNDLSKLGLTPNKSKTIKLPDVPAKYFSHFVRGYFDGDGNVTISKYRRANRNNKDSVTILSGFISGSKELLEKLSFRLRKLAEISGGTLYYSNKGYRLFFSVSDSLKLYKFMYRNINNELLLTRKKKVFEKYFEIG